MRVQGRSIFSLSKVSSEVKNPHTGSITQFHSMTDILYESLDATDLPLAHARADVRVELVFKGGQLSQQGARLPTSLSLAETRVPKFADCAIFLF